MIIFHRVDFMMGRQGDMFIFIITLRIHRSGHETALHGGPSASFHQVLWDSAPHKRFDHTIRLTSFFKSWPFDSPSWRSRFQPWKGHKNGLKRGHFEEPGTYMYMYTCYYSFGWTSCTLPLLESPFNTCFFLCFFSLAAWFLRYSRQQTLILMSSLYFFFVPTWVSLHLRHHSTTFLLSNSSSAAWSIP